MNAVEVLMIEEGFMELVLAIEAFRGKAVKGAQP
jgi:hypothetical protein